MKNKFFATSVALLTIGSDIYKSAYEFGQKICYRGSFEENDMNDFLINHDMKQIRIKNHKGLILQGYLMEVENADKTVIIAHPFNKSALQMENYIEYFKRVLNNVNILLFDANGHGNSDGYIRGFGYHDITDLMYWNTYILQRYGNDHSIIMYGKEMGANTILNAAGLNKLKNVKAIVSEGAYDNVYSYLGYMFAKNEYTMNFVAPVIQKAIKDELSWNIRNMDTVKLIETNKIPVLFVHSNKDHLVPFSNVLELFNHDHSIKELFPIKEKHLYQIEDDEYSNIIKEFLAQNV